MTSVINEFKVFKSCPKKIKRKIKSFHVFKNNLAICVTTDDIVYAFGTEYLIEDYLGYEEEDIEDNYQQISELCKQNVEQFFCFFGFLFAKTSDNKIYSSGSNEHGELARGYKSYDYLKPKRIEFFDDKNIIDISGGSEYCLALSSEGLVYGWGDNSDHVFHDNLKTDSNSESDEESEELMEWEEVLTPVLINNEFGVNKSVKHIHCFFGTSVMVTFDGFVYVLDPRKHFFKHKLTELSEVYKIYLGLYNSAVVLKNNGIIEYFSDEKRKTIEISFDSLVDTHLYQNEADFNEIIIQTKDQIITIDMNHEFVDKSKDTNPFKYCLFKYESTFKTIHLKEKHFYYKSFEFNENTNTLNESIKIIDFDVEEYRNKYYNRNDSQNLKKFRNSKTLLLPEILESKVKFYYQIGSRADSNESAFFVTNDNKVYAIGWNKSGALGLGHNRYVNDFTLIEELCDQNIEEFFEGNDCMFARSNRNKIFVWNIYLHSQFMQGYDSVDPVYFPKPIKIDFFDDKNIIEISCGSDHYLGLSKDGQVYGWGRNKYGQTGSGNDNKEVVIPMKIQLSDSSDNRIKFIHCSGSTSSAVTVDGRAFIWGKVNENKLFIPEVIETDVSKMYLKSSLEFSILTTNEIFKQKRFFESLNTETIVESEDVFDIRVCDVLLISEVVSKDDAVYEVIDKKKRKNQKKKFKTDGNNQTKELKKTKFSNFFEYFCYKKKRIIETIHITSDGYLKRQTIELNSKTKLLEKVFKNIFDRKFENCFEFMKRIGEGGYGYVYKVKSKTNSDLFAIKRILIRGDISETLREIKIMSQLKSKFVVKYHNSWTEGKVIDTEINTYVYIQMELCSQNLKTFNKFINNSFDEKFKTIKYFIKSELLVEIIECLNHLHSKNIIHRDLTQQNILVTDGSNNRFLKLCDFGLSKINENSQNTRDVGTREGMPPEVLDRDHYDSKTDRSNYSLKSDIYRLGFVAKNLFDLNESIPRIRELKLSDKYLDRFSNTILKEKFSKLLKEISIMLSKEPEDRRSCSELLANTHKWTVDTNVVRSDESYEQFIRITEKEENLGIFKNFIELKLK